MLHIQERKFELLKEEFNQRYNDLNQHVHQVSNNQGIDIASLAVSLLLNCLL